LELYTGFIESSGSCMENLTNMSEPQVSHSMNIVV